MIFKDSFKLMWDLELVPGSFIDTNAHIYSKNHHFNKLNFPKSYHEEKVSNIQKIIHCKADIRS